MPARMVWIATLSLLLPVLVFAGYPALVIAIAAVLPRRTPSALPGATPSISIIICAYNEGPRIGAKLASVQAALAQWPGTAEIIIGDDGSSDDTAAVAEQHGATVLRCPRGGKASVLNRVTAMASGDVLVMTDADPLFDLHTLPALLAPFADPDVGAVAGRVETIRSGNAGRAGGFAAADGLFRAYESRLRAAEDRLFGCISADGGLYAIRRTLMPHVPPDVTDDFHVSTAAVAAGKRIAFADDARVWEHAIVGARRQFRRRIRITVRGLTALWRRRALMNPWRTGWYAAALVLHKVGRRLAPLALVPLPIASGVLALQGSLFWALILLGLVGAATIVGAGALGWRLPKPLRLIDNAVLQLTGLAIGALLFASGRRYAQWTPQKDAAA